MFLSGATLAKPKPDSIDYLDLVREIETGLVKIPAFQRDFVWDLKDVVDFLDSIYRGYPIGSFLFWETGEYLNSLRDIGNLDLPSVPEGRFVKYVLDGQQRITSLYAAIKEATVRGKSYKIYFDLASKKFVNPTELQDNIDPGRHVPLAKILDKLNFGTNLMAVSPQYQNAFNEVYQNFIGYPFPYVLVREQPIEVVCEIFERVNTKGKKLSVVDLVVAKTWSEIFDLRVKLNEFRKKLVASDYGDIQDINILQALSCIIKGGCKRAEILSIKRDELYTNWNNAIKSVELAIDFFRNKMGIPISKVLPYPIEIVPVAYFYHRNQFKEPDNDQTEKISKWFWRASLSGRYDSAIETKIGDDVKEIDKILARGEPSLEYPINLSVEKIIKQDYTLKSAFCLTILSLYATKQPKNFENNGVVDLTSKNFSKYNSKEMHHLFPVAYLRRTKVEKDIALTNSIANICFIPSKLNKDILDRPPKDYFTKYSSSNSNILGALGSHLVGDLATFGIDTNNFEQFLFQRAQKIEEEFRKVASLPTITLQASISSSAGVVVTNPDPGQTRLTSP